MAGICLFVGQADFMLGVIGLFFWMDLLIKYSLYLFIFNGLLSFFGIWSV